MITNSDHRAHRQFDAIGVRCEVVADTEAIADEAVVIAITQLAELDGVASRFRVDSELSTLRHGTEVAVSPLLSDVIGAALRVGDRTDGLVDPTVGRAVRTLGYDADFDTLAGRPSFAAAEVQPAPGYWRVVHDSINHRVLVPHGVELDFGASARAWAADRAARTLAARLPGSFLVNLSGDLAVSGVTALHGWPITIDDGGAGDRPVISIRRGGIATSSTAKRTWTVGGRTVHHIVDPRTGESADPVWRAVTVTAGSCELANAAATAAIVLGTAAPSWLAHRRLHARLVSHQDEVVFVGDWPEGNPARRNAATA